jgi:hypothetical protein
MANNRHVQYNAFEISPDGARVVYLADARTYQRYELFSAPLDGSAAPVPLHGPAEPNGDFTHFLVDPRGTHVLYVTNRDTGAFDLFRVSILGDAPPVQLSGPMAGEGVLPYPPRFGVTPDGARAVYVADQDEHGIYELFAAIQEPSAARASRPRAP